jgi:hypothetical protein
VCITADEIAHWRVRQQLEYTTAEKKGIKLVKPPITAAAVCDTAGTALYFLEYDDTTPTSEASVGGTGADTVLVSSTYEPCAVCLRFFVGRNPMDSSWALIYPMDV